MATVGLICKRCGCVHQLVLERAAAELTLSGADVVTCSSCGYQAPCHAWSDATREELRSRLVPARAAG